MKSYLVTGGCGFIGTNLVSRLCSQNASVRIFDNLTAGRREDVASLPVDLQTGDIRDRTALSQACDGIDIVIHLAAHTRVIDSIADPELNFEINAAGTLNVLSASLARGVSKVVFASTGGAILGEQESPVHEEMVPHPVSPYGASKLAGEAYCSAFFGSFGLNTVSLRFSNVYGPFSYHKGSVVAQFFKSLLDGKRLVIYGDGKQTRDFVYVGDLVEAILLACDKDTSGQAFQIASGQETSLLSLVDLMRRVMPEANLELGYRSPRRGEILRNYASIDKARRMLGYEPKTSLEDGLRATWEWFVSRSSRLRL